MAVDTYGAYAQKIEHELNERNGRLFLTDSDKYRAASAVVSVSLKSESAVYVVSDVDTATDFADLFGGKAKIITSVDGFNSLLDEASGGFNESKYKKIAAGFKTRYPYVVVSATDDQGECLFNRKLCSDSSLFGSFVGAIESAPYCISDFFADCRYDIAVIDDVYSLICLEEKDLSDNAAMSLSPSAYDCVSFMGKWYFADVNHSYKRLRNLCNSASKRVLISDVMAYDKLVDFYAALCLLDLGFDMFAAEQTVRRADAAYEDIVGSVCADINMAKSDEFVIKGLIVKLRDSKQILPQNVEGLSNHIDICVRYTSSAELFLRIIGAYIAEKGRLGKLDEALESLQDSNSLLASCLYRAFFTDAIKETIEGSVSCDRLCTATESEADTLHKIYLRYGVCEQYHYDCDNVDTIRIMRDDSGYEAFIEKHASFVKNNSEGAPVVDETEYSVIHSGSDLLYECATLVQICTDAAAPRKAVLPLLLVTRDNIDEAERTLKRLMPSWKISTDFSDVSKITEHAVILTDFNRLEKSARKIGVKTVVFFGSPANPQKLLALVNKCSSEGSRSIIITRYGDLSARLSAKWNEIIERNTDRALPFGMGTIKVKDNRFDDYEKAIACVEDAYVALKKVALGESSDVDGLTDKFKKLLLDYADDSSLDINVAKKDFNYLTHISVAYGNVFKNSVSVGRAGEKISEYPHTKYIKNAVESDRVMLFNVCAKMLRRNCDGKQASCNGCAEYFKYSKNSFKLFEQSVHAFFDDTMEYARKRDAERQKESDADKIHNVVRAEDATLLTSAAVEEAENRVLNGLDKIMEEVGKYNGVFATDYEPIQNIKSAVIELYARALDRYFARLIAIFDDLSGRVIVRK